MIEDCKELADYYEDLVDTISKFSFVVNKDGGFTESKSFEGLNFSKFVQNCSKVMQTFLSHHRAKNRIDLETEDFDTVIFPTVQMGLYNVTQVLKDKIYFFILHPKTKGFMFSGLRHYLRNIKSWKSRFFLPLCYGLLQPDGPVHEGPHGDDQVPVPAPDGAPRG